MTQSNPLRVGLIGAGGRWGPRAHVPALKGLAETDLYAVCTAHADTAQAAADKFGVTTAYGAARRREVAALGAARPDQWIGLVLETVEDRVVDPRVLHELVLPGQVRIQCDEVDAALLA